MGIEFLAQASTQIARDPRTFGWFLGLGIAFGIIVVVVIVVATILTLARRIGVQAQMAIKELDDGRVHTMALWDVQKTSDGIKGITDGLRAARGALGG